MSSLEKNQHGVALSRTVGHAVAWHQPGWPRFVADQPHSYASREVIAIAAGPELDLAGRGTVWAAMHDAALAMLTNAALLVGCHAFEVRYLVRPDPVGGTTVRMFLTAMTHDWNSSFAEAAVQAACNALPAGFVTAEPRERPQFGGQPPAGQIVVELRRKEMLSYPTWDYIPADFYYTIADDPGDGSGWAAFWRSFTSACQPVTISLLFQQTELHPVELAVLGSLLTDLGRYSESRTDYDFLNNPIVYPACADARLTLQSWERRLERLRRPLLARIAVRSEVTTAASTANALAAAIGISSEATGSQIMEIEAALAGGDERQANFGFDWMEIMPWGGHEVWTHPRAPISLRRLPYLFGIDDAAGLLVLPVPDEQGAIGLPRARRLVGRRQAVPDEHPGTGVPLGTAVHHGAAGAGVTLPLSAINRHTLIVGAPGSGKTTTVQTLLSSLWLNHRIPFLVIESAKAEFRTLLAAPGMAALRVITLGNESIAPLRLNPLAPPPGVRAEIHQGTVLAALKLALPLFPPLPQLLSTAIARTYEAAGWHDETTMADGIVPPTLRDLRRHFWELFQQVGYQGEARNIGRAFDARLESLLQGSRGKVLDTISSSDLPGMLREPLVVEMNDVHDSDDRSVLAAFLLDRVRAAATARGNSGGQLRHVTVLEEAHRLLSKAELGADPSGNGDVTRSEAVRAFCDAIAELRSVGEGFIICSQRPSALADAAVANTGTRILHRMESSTDRTMMLNDLDADEQVRQASARLRRGEAVVRWPERDEIEIVQVTAAAAVDTGQAMSDQVVTEQMAGYRTQIGHLLPYRLCSPEICPAGCLATVRRVGASTARAVAAQAAELWQQPDAVPAIIGLLAAEPAATVQSACCAASQLNAQSTALLVDAGQDGRPGLIRAVREVFARGQK